MITIYGTHSCPDCSYLAPQIEGLVEQPGFYRAYHMNKAQWISIFLDGTVEEETIKKLIAESYEKTRAKRRKR